MRQKYGEVVGDRYYNKSIKIRCLVSGKSLVPYYVPKVIRVKCLAKGECDNCKFQKSVDLLVNAIDERILMFVDVPTQRMGSVVKSVFSISCHRFSHEVIEVQNIERLNISQPTGKERSQGSQNRNAFFVGHGIDVNTLYDLEGYTTTDPSNQSVTHVFTSATKVKSDVESFSISTKSHNELCEFQIKTNDVSDMWTRLMEVYEGYAHSVTRIFKREDLHMSVDLAFRSVVSFRLDNEIVKKGWSDVMIIGDTRCGKGYVAERLSEYFGVGETISADNCSFAGLVGGLQQFSKHWVVTWGKIPLNDMGLVIIDEASEVKESDWTRLSRLRSEGVAEIFKIQSQVTNARTRIIWLSNPPNKTISAYSYGIQSVLDVVKTPEDVARFDYVLVVSHDEVDTKEINQSQSKLSALYDRRLEHELILWTWSRSVDEIEFTNKAVKVIYDQAISLSKRYDFSIPLIQGENVRIKLAKIAISIAARFYSTIDGKVLKVEPHHVEFARYFLDTIYSKESSGYLVYSKINRSATSDEISENMKKIKKYIGSWTTQQNLVRCLLTNNSITVNSLMEHMCITRERAYEIISKLLLSKCIIKKYDYYIKTPSFTGWLKRKIMGKGDDGEYEC